MTDLSGFHIPHNSMCGNSIKTSIILLKLRHLVSNGQVEPKLRDKFRFECVTNFLLNGRNFLSLSVDVDKFPFEWFTNFLLNGCQISF